MKMVDGKAVELSHAEEAELAALQASWALEDAASNNRAAILAELKENDLKAIRALLDGDSLRVAEWRDKQSVLRAKLK